MRITNENTGLQDLDVPVASDLKIPPIALFTAALLLSIGELAVGTNLYFVAMMLIAITSIGITYNLLGGLRTFSGLLFAGFATRTIVISQFAKVLLRERADIGLEFPNITISIYAVFFACAMLGTYFYGRIRLNLPRPVEPSTESDYRIYYWLSFGVGLAATFMFEMYEGTYNRAETVYNLQHSLGVALRPLLFLSLILAVDIRIRQTRGKHSFSFLALLPSLVAVGTGFVDTTRTSVLAPFVVYALTCFVRGYRFRLRHYCAILAVAVLFVTVLSPLALYGRQYVAGQTLEDRALAAERFVGQGKYAANVVGWSIAEQYSREGYFVRQGPYTYLLTRLSMIGIDSTIVTAMETGGSHYGFAPTKITALQSVPSILYKNKPRDISAQDYIGQATGMSSDSSPTSNPQFSAVGDSYGAFGWLGVALFPLLVFPAIFVVFESTFDVTKPWGTVALAGAFFQFGEMMVDRTITMFVLLLTMLAASAALALVCNLIPRSVGGFSDMFAPRMLRRIIRHRPSSTPEWG